MSSTSALLTPPAVVLAAAASGAHALLVDDASPLVALPTSGSARGSAAGSAAGSVDGGGGLGGGVHPATGACAERLLDDVFYVVFSSIRASHEEEDSCSKCVLGVFRCVSAH